MESPYSEEKLNLIREDSEKIRGRILDAVVSVEMALSTFIVYYFSKENLTDDFYKHIVSDRLTFETKKNIFSSLKKEGKIVSDSFYKTLVSDLDYLQNVRNMVAHSYLNLDPSYINSYDGKKIVFVHVGAKKYHQHIIIWNKVEIENREDLVYSFPEIIDTANRVLDALHKFLFPTN